MDKLEAAIHVYKQLRNAEVVSRNVTGVVDEGVYEDCKKELIRHDILVSDNDDDCKLEFFLPLENDGLFAIDIEDLLQAPSRLLDPPVKFYLADKDYLYSAENDTWPEDVKNYFDVSLFAKTLYKLADYGIKKDPKAIFLHGEKLELSLAFTVDDLLPLSGLSDFVADFVNAEIHKEQKATIIKGVLHEMLKNNEIDRLTISCLIKRFTEFIERVNANYQLYVSEFSFDKIKDQVENEKFEFTLKLNGVISSIQNQLLAVPVALILVGSQMQKTEGMSLGNVSVWISALIFGFFMSLLIRNQRSTLAAIKVEIDSQWRSIESRHKFVAERLGVHYFDLIRRYWLQRWFLMLVSFVVACSVFGSTGLLLYNSGLILLYDRILESGAYAGAVYVVACLMWRIGVRKGWLRLIVDCCSNKN